MQRLRLERRAISFLTGRFKRLMGSWYGLINLENKKHCYSRAALVIYMLGHLLSIERTSAE